MSRRLAPAPGALLLAVALQAMALLLPCSSVPELDLSSLQLGGRPWSGAGQASLGTHDGAHAGPRQHPQRQRSASMGGDAHASRRLLEDAPAPRPLIYVYELPEKFTDFKTHGDISDSFYGLDQLFPELLLSSHHITKNGNEADFFYVHAWLMHPKTSVREIISALQDAGPWWDRKQGADHIFSMPSEMGRCDFQDTEGAIHAILLHHFGMLQNTRRGPCDLDNMWGAHCDDEMIISERAIFRRPAIEDACHIPGQDIVVPPVSYEPHPQKPGTWGFATPYLNGSLQGLPRNDMLFYSGVIDLDAGDAELSRSQPWHDAGYSFGARQTLHRMFHASPGMALLDHHVGDEYWARVSRALFCVAAAGWGWGGRMKAAVTRGCLPLIVQDGILVEFEEQLPLKEYALRLPLWMTHKTPPILAVFNDTGRVRNMQKALECTWRLHWWRRPHGRAFEVVMCELKRRLLSTPDDRKNINLDTDACTLDCGDGRLINLLKDHSTGL